MIRDEKFLLLAADSTHYVIYLEGVLKENDIPTRVIPLPTEISANCGLSLKVDLIYKDRVQEIIKNQEFKLGFYMIEKHGLKKEIKELGGN